MIVNNRPSARPAPYIRARINYYTFYIVRSADVTRATSNVCTHACTCGKYGTQEKRTPTHASPCMGARKSEIRTDVLRQNEGFPAVGVTYCVRFRVTRDRVPSGDASVGGSGSNPVWWGLGAGFSKRPSRFVFFIFKNCFYFSDTVFISERHEKKLKFL